MSVKRVLKSLFAIVLLVALGGFLFWVALKARKEPAGEKGEEETKKDEATHVSAEGGESVVKISKDVQAKSGIATVSLAKISQREQERVYGTVLDVQELIDLRNNYISGKAQVEKARASLSASRKEYERLKGLFESNGNVSDKALQAAEAAWRSDEATLPAAQAALPAMEATARQKWGPVLAGWVIESSPNLERLTQQQDVLIQLTLVATAALPSAPPTAMIQDAAGKFVPAEFVSPSPRTDPRIQGISFFYKAPQKATRLVAGMNVLAYLAVGPELSGVVVPADAVVSWQGKAWVYVKKGEEQFARRQIAMEMPAQDGWFVSKGLSPGDLVVATGAQQILSEEFRSQIQTEE